MIRGLNKFLRGCFFVFGGLLLLMELFPVKRRAQDNREGFDNEEYDDIW